MPRSSLYHTFPFTGPIYNTPQPQPPAPPNPPLPPIEPYPGDAVGKIDDDPWKDYNPWAEAAKDERTGPGISSSGTFSAGSLFGDPTAVFGNFGGAELLAGGSFGGGAAGGGLANLLPGLAGGLAGGLVGGAIGGGSSGGTSTGTGAGGLLNPNTIAGQSQALTAQYGPGNMRNFTSLLGQGLLGNEGVAGLDPASISGIMAKLAPFLDSLQVGSNTTARAGDLGDLQGMGSAWAQAIRDANPDLARTTGNLESAVAGGRGRAPLSVTAAQADPARAELERAQASSLMPGLESAASSALGSRSQIQAELERQAMAELATGGRLSGEATRDAEQATRAAFADRGMAMSNSAIFQEALNKETLTRQRAAEARALGLTVDQNAQQADARNREFALGVADRGTALNQYNAGAANQMGQFNASQGNQVGMFNAGQSNQLGMFNADLARLMDNDQFSRELALTGVRQSQAIDPTQLLNARGVGTGASAGLIAQTPVPPLFDPGLASLYNANFNAQQANNISSGNNQSALWGSVIGGLGNIFGGYLANRPGA
jgi:hypothetical protein